MYKRQQAALVTATAPNQPTSGFTNLIKTQSRDNADFGDFEDATPEPKKDPVAESKWGDLSKLVNLDGMGKEQERAKQEKVSKLYFRIEVFTQYD